jgi:squalene cyclase
VRSRSLLFLIALAASAQSPEQRAVDYLSREVPRWSKENGCFSCHNNGDGARALYAAAGRGYKVPEAALADTTAWLLKPASWDENRGEGGVSDKKLARIQFASALAEAVESGRLKDRAALTRAAESLLSYQEPDGSWRVDVGGAGSPATYGAALATYMARRVLQAGYREDFAEAMSKATLWLLRNTPRSAIEMASALLALSPAEPDARRCRDLLLASQASDGGWGPYPGSPTEPFDTAVALLALRKSEAAAKSIERARAYLVAQQQTSGGWIETTRPPGGHSYAQHISTSAWAALALVMTDKQK